MQTPRARSYVARASRWQESEELANGVPVPPASPAAVNKFEECHLLAKQAIEYHDDAGDMMDRIKTQAHLGFKKLMESPLTKLFAPGIEDNYKNLMFKGTKRWDVQFKDELMALDAEENESQELNDFHKRYVTCAQGWCAVIALRMKNLDPAREFITRDMYEHALAQFADRAIGNDLIERRNEAITKYAETRIPASPKQQEQMQPQGSRMLPALPPPPAKRTKLDGVTRGKIEIVAPH